MNSFSALRTGGIGGGAGQFDYTSSLEGILGRHLDVKFRYAASRPLAAGINTRTIVKRSLQIAEFGRSCCRRPLWLPHCSRFHGPGFSGQFPILSAMGSSRQSACRLLPVFGRFGSFACRRKGTLTGVLERQTVFSISRSQRRQTGRPAAPMILPTRFGASTSAAWQLILRG